MPLTPGTTLGPYSVTAKIGEGEVCRARDTQCLCPQIDRLPPEEQQPQLSGAREFQVTKGDMLHVPARVWHQVVVEDEKSLTYALINVIE